MADTEANLPPALPAPNSPVDLNAIVECDPQAPLPTANNFRQQPIYSIPTEGNPVRDNDLCDNRWQWYRMRTEYTRSVSRVERIVGADGVTRTETLYSQVPDVASVVIIFDSIWTRQTNRFPTSDVMIVNGFDNMPTNWDIPSLFQPDVSVGQAAPGTIAWYTAVDTLTHTVGFNTTLSPLGCAAAVEEYIMVGVRCGWGQAIACRYELSAKLIPRRVYDGDVVEAPIGAGELHTFALDIGSYDVATFTLLRIGHDLTYTLPDSEGVLHTHMHDFALRGELLAQRGYCPDPSLTPPPPPPPSPPPDPPNIAADGAASTGSAMAGGALGSASTDGDWFRYRMTPITNASGTAVLDFFCTTAADEGPWAIAVRAAVVQGPIGLAVEQSNENGPSCEDGYVGPDGVPIYTSPSALGSLPQCNPSGGGNELKANRPYYRLNVLHSAFSQVAFAAHESRPACIGFGQMRRFSVVSDGQDAANLYVALSTKVSRVLIAEGKSPTLAQHDVASVDDAMYAASYSPNAMPPAPGADMHTTASASPCDPAVTRTWFFAVYLEEEVAARAKGLAPAAFDLNLSLSSARRDALGDLITPRAAGGVGSTCCGRMTHFTVRLNTSLLALRARVNVTAGALRAVYVKHSSCPSYPADILGQQCDANVAQCHMTWYERFDRYTGEKRYAASNTTLVPAGGDFPDKRAGGVWYISLQDAGVSRRTDFTLEIDAVTPGADASEAACDRFGRYDCNNVMWKVPPELDALFDSAAAPRATAVAGGWAGGLLVLPTLLLTWMAGRRWR